MSTPISIDIEVTSPAVGVEIATPAVDVTPDPSGAEVIVVPVPGPPGPAGGSYLHEQAAPAAVWDITHNLGQAVVTIGAVYDAGYDQQFWNVICEPLTDNTCRLFFGDPVAGYALVHS